MCYVTVTLMTFDNLERTDCPYKRIPLGDFSLNRKKSERLSSLRKLMQSRSKAEVSYRKSV